MVVAGPPPIRGFGTRLASQAPYCHAGFEEFALAEPEGFINHAITRDRAILSRYGTPTEPPAKRSAGTFQNDLRDEGRYEVNQRLKVRILIVPFPGFELGNADGRLAAKVVA